HPLQAASPLLQRIQPAGRIEAADHGADRGADHDVRYDAIGGQGSEDADMGKAARRATAERQANDRPSHAAKTDLLSIGAVRAPTLQDIKHRNPPTPGQPSQQSRRRTSAPPERGQSVVYTVRGSRGQECGEERLPPV